MKKIISAILIATMVFGFNSCNNDELNTEIDGVSEKVEAQAATIATLQSEITTLKTALAEAQQKADAAAKAAADAAAAVEAAQNEAEAAKAAAQEAKNAADAAAVVAEQNAAKIQEALTLVEGIKSAYEAEIARINNELAGKVSKDEVDAAIAAASKTVEDALVVINTRLATLEGEIESLKAGLAAIDSKLDKSAFDEQVLELIAKDAELADQIAALEKAIKDGFGGEDYDITESLQSVLQMLQEAYMMAFNAYEAINMENGIAAQISELSSLVGANKGKIDELWEAVFGDNSTIFSSIHSLNSRIEDAEGDIAANAQSILDLWAEISGVGGIKDQISQLNNALGARIDEISGKIDAISANLNTFNSMIRDLANQIQSVVIVPQKFRIHNDLAFDGADYDGDGNVDWNELNHSYWTNVVEQVLEDRLAVTHVYWYSTDWTYNESDYYYVSAVYEVTPKAAVATLKDENLCFSTVALKDLPAEYLQAKIVERDVNSGRMVVMGFVPKDSETLNINSLALALNISQDKIYNVEDEDGLMETINAGTNIMSSYNLVNSHESELNHVQLNSNMKFKIDEDYQRGYVKSFVMPFRTATDESRTNLFEYEEVVFPWNGYHFTADEFKALFDIDFEVTLKSEVTYYNVEEGKTSPILVVCEKGNEKAATAELVASEDYPEAAAVGKSARVVLSYAIDGCECKSASARYVIVPDQADIKLGKATKTWVYSDGDLANVSGVEIAVEESEVDMTSLYNNTCVFQTTVGEDTYDAYVTFLSDEKARIEFAEAPYVQGESVIYRFTSKIDLGTIVYNAAFDLELGAMPEDATINVGEFTDYAYLSRDFAVESAKLGLVYSQLLDRPEFAQFKADCENAEPALDPLAEIASRLTMSGSELLVMSYDSVEGVENSYIYIPQDQIEIDGVYEIVQKYNIFGIEYTFTAKVTLEQPEYEIIPNPIYVADGKVTLTGDKKGGVYVLDVVKLIDYIRYGEGVEDLIGTELAIKYECTDKDNKIAFDTTDPSKVIFDNDNQRNVYNFKISLVNLYDDEIVYGEPVSIEASIDELIEFKEVKNQLEVKYENGAAVTETNIVKALLAVDDVIADADGAIYNSAATSLDDFFAGHAEYAQKLTIIEKDIIAYLDKNTDAKYEEGSIFTVDADGTVQLTLHNTANITSDIIVEVPVELTHNYCGAEPHVRLITVRFTIK